MKVSKDVTKFVDLFEESSYGYKKRPRNLCALSWYVVAKATVLVGFGSLVCLLTLVPIIGWTVWAITGLYPAAGTFFESIFIISSILLFIAALITLLYWCKVVLKRWLRMGGDEEEGITSTNIVWLWVKAKKERFCPTVEYEDERTDSYGHPVRRDYP